MSIGAKVRVPLYEEVSRYMRRAVGCVERDYESRPLSCTSVIAVRCSA